MFLNYDFDFQAENSLVGKDTWEYEEKEAGIVAQVSDGALGFWWAQWEDSEWIQEILDRFGDDLSVRCWYHRFYPGFGMSNGVDGEAIFPGGEN